MCKDIFPFFFHQGLSSKARFGFRRVRTARDQIKEAAFEPATDTAIKSNHYYIYRNFMLSTLLNKPQLCQNTTFLLLSAMENIL